MKETTLSLLGRITDVNPLGELPPGACSVADNIMLRRKGVIEPRIAFRGLISYTALFWDYVRLFAADASMLGALYNFTVPAYALAWNSGAGVTGATISNSGSTYAPSFDVGKVQFAKTRARYIVTDKRQPIIFDREGASTARLTGLPAPASIDIGQTVSTGGIWANNTIANWRATFVRKQSDGYLLVGPTSNAQYATNNGGVTNIPVMTVYWGTGTPLVAGDSIYLYRTKFVAAGTDPGDTCFFAAAYTLTNTDIANRYASFNDVCRDSALGVELYTNPGQEGAQQSSFAPPPSFDVCAWQGFAFYAASSGLQQITSSIPYQLSAGLVTATERAQGIGVRTTPGDTTIGSPNIINVSATNMNGIVAGQRVTSAKFPAGTKVSSASGTTVVCDHNATANSVGFGHVITDVIEVSGTEYVIDTPFDMFSLLGRGSTAMAFTSPSIDPYVIPSFQGVQFTLVATTPFTGSFTVRATNGQNYSPALPQITGTVQTSDSDARTNRVYFSKLQQPEAVPVLNYFYVGDATILRMVPTKSAIYMFCTDGIYRVSGSGGQWRVDLFDRNTVLVNTNCVDVMGDVIFALTNKGFTAIGDAVGVQDLDQGLIGADMRERVATVITSAYQWGVQLACDIQHNEVWLSFGTVGFASGDSIFVFNSDTGQFATCSDEVATALTYSAFYGSAVLSDGQGQATPDTASQLRYSYGDADTTHRMNATFNLQPIVAGDAGKLKQWGQIEYIFKNQGAGFQFYPLINSNTATNVTLPNVVGSDLRIATWPGLADAYAAQIEIGLQALTVSQNWQLEGIKVRFRAIAGDQVVR